MEKFTKSELLNFNEMLLGRGAPVQEDGIGYNKADYGACATYYYGLSDAQFADLAKRLVKYSETQLKVCKKAMQETAKELGAKADAKDRSRGISIDVKETSTLISFRYNEQFIDAIKSQPKRQWDAENKKWVVPNENAIDVLKALGKVGADVKNAIEYFEIKRRG